MNNEIKTIVLLILILLASCANVKHEKVSNLITHQEINDIIKSNFKVGFFSDYKILLTDRVYYAPKIKDLVDDYELAKRNIADEFNLSVNALNTLFSNHKDNESSIWDCDNIANYLKHSLNKIHYKRYIENEHTIKYEYAAFRAFVSGWKGDEIQKNRTLPILISAPLHNYGNSEKEGTGHVYLIVITNNREIYIINFPDKILKKNQWKPKIQFLD